MDKDCSSTDVDWGGVIASLALIGCLLVDNPTTIGRIAITVVVLVAMIEFATGGLSRIVISAFRKARSKW